MSKELLSKILGSVGFFGSIVSYIIFVEDNILKAGFIGLTIGIILSQIPLYVMKDKKDK
ncbi:hypothetical protein [Candidatus Vampirococcus lugosii]|uniref:Uncharacterized protein n=1 Tax=Candidatus Vampirococcus lugosii TaxID=2789015 RepID=A0ABS5QNF6_9BACT|nr:hypothetical protein [Candidatus Vampirococcus lugosii]MBS8122534.1 hypothetical protein [Candidatus Vampirococcus lugosii]